MTDHYQLIKTHRNGTQSNVFELDGPDGRVAFKVTTSRMAKKEYANLERLTGIPNVPKPLGFLGTDFRDYLGLDLSVLGGYTTGFLMECVPDAQHISKARQGPEFFDQVRAIARQVYARNLQLPSDIINGENVLVSSGEPWLIDWHDANNLSSSNEPLEKAIADQNVWIDILEKKYSVKK